jgi:UDP-2,3-diacylglucosamine pyrophosphatase LpxH
MKRLIISDLHLGATFSREELLISLLEEKEYDELILAGDIIEFLKVPYFTENSKKIFQTLQKINKPIVYVIGNHDRALEAFVDSSLGCVRFTKRYEFEESGRTFAIEHGDQHEGGILQRRFVMKFVALVGDILERAFNWNSNKFYDWFKSRRKRIKYVRNIMKYSGDTDVFIMGHTHTPEAMIWIDENEKIRTYINTGDWVEHATYVMIDGPQARLKNYLNEKK